MKIFKALIVPISYGLAIHKNVGVKIGWIYKESNYPMAYSTIAAALKKWDELKFDRYSKTTRNRYN